MMQFTKPLETFLWVLLLVNVIACVWMYSLLMPPEWSPAKEQPLLRGKAIVPATLVSSDTTALISLDAMLERRIVLAAEKEGKDPALWLPDPTFRAEVLQKQDAEGIDALIQEYKDKLEQLGSQLDFRIE